MSAVLLCIIGLAVLILGRKLFWIFVAAVGFALGMMLVPQFLPDAPQWLILLVALVAGCVGAVLAVLLQRIAVGVAGFISGGYLVWWLLTFLNVHLGEWQTLSWVVFIVGGIAGALLLSMVFDLALIILSSAAGAGLIADTLMSAFSLQKLAVAIIFLILFAIGIAVQSGIMRRER